MVLIQAQVPKFPWNLMAFEKGKRRLGFRHNACLKVLKITFLCLCVFTVTFLSVESSAFLNQPLAGNWYTSLLENLLCRDRNILALKVVGDVFHYYGSLSNSQSMWNADAAETSALVLMAVHSNYPGVVQGRVFLVLGKHSGMMARVTGSSLFPDFSCKCGGKWYMKSQPEGVQERAVKGNWWNYNSIWRRNYKTEFQFQLRLSSHSGVNQAFFIS